MNYYLFTFLAIAQRYSQIETSEFSENSTGCKKSEKVSDCLSKKKTIKNDELIKLLS